MQETLRVLREDFPFVAGGDSYCRLADGIRAPYRLPPAVSTCDTAYAFNGGEIVTLDSILDQVAAYRPRYVCVTGGEPLAQPNCIPLPHVCAMPVTRCHWKPVARSTSRPSIHG